MGHASARAKHPRLEVSLGLMPVIHTIRPSGVTANLVARGASSHWRPESLDGAAFDFALLARVPGREDITPISISGRRRLQLVV